VVVLTPSPLTDAQPMTPVVSLLQLPPEQPPEHALPQPPQCAGSLSVSRH
jgi:hypothetical protein